jgi:hypothetical protein
MAATVLSVSRKNLFLTITYSDGRVYRRQLGYADTISSVVVAGDYKVLQAHRNSTGNLVITYEDSSGAPQTMTLENSGTAAAAIVTHVAEADPHTGYRLESADHSHQSTGAQAGKLDHGLALDGLTDDDHTQYIKHSLATALSDFLVASGAGAFVKKTLAEVQAIIFGTALPEDTAITLDDAISGTGHYSGIVEAGVLGATVAFGECVYQKPSDSQWYLAQADVTATSGAVKLGICLLAGNDNDPTVILLWGKVNAAAVFPSFGVLAPVFISAATPGALTSTAPTGTTNFVVRIVGYANTADELFFQPDNTYVELA